MVRYRALSGAGLIILSCGGGNDAGIVQGPPGVSAIDTIPVNEAAVTDSSGGRTGGDTDTAEVDASAVSEAAPGGGPSSNAGGDSDTAGTDATRGNEAEVGDASGGRGIGGNSDAAGTEFWVAKIARGLGEGHGVWNLGSGWGRAADAASDGFWLYKAKQCDEVAIIFGINDILNSQRTVEQILGDLTMIIASLRQNRPDASIILFTIPPFDLMGDDANTWRTVNDAIRTTPPEGTDRVFDIAAVESQPAPNDNLTRPEIGGGHPSDAGSSIIADAFLEFYSE